jgi:hypothetical protein
MRTLLLLLVLSPLPLSAQEMPSLRTEPRQQAPASEAETAPTDRTITVPEGTRVELALANPVRTRNAHVGEIVRAVTNFPVAVDQDVAIPQGTYVEGRIARVGKRGSTLFDGLQIDFKQLLFSNGYVVALDGSVVEARAIAPIANPSGRIGAAGIIANPLQQGPAPTPPPQVGPPKGPIIAASLGGTVALLVAGILFGHHHLHEEPRDFDTGFQFEMVLRAPLTLDRARVAAALDRSSENELSSGSQRAASVKASSDGFGAEYALEPRAGKLHAY